MSDLKTEPVKDQNQNQEGLDQPKAELPQNSNVTEKKETMPKSTFVFQSGNNRKP